ncbi:MAG: hypothetical protein A2284_10125 [Deltaproteobacteria bacterium RIFOXYA12_FULL_61_11]|nr:MAG: hypothetical protein A2284_10125 [Deltaproteobacteria bacterium RIFOXYA12_FULL_61_11]
MRSTSPPSKNRLKPLRRSSALCLAAFAGGLALWLTILPTLQFHHLLFSDHEHTFCDVHQRFEDVPRGTFSTNPGFLAAVSELVPRWSHRPFGSRPVPHHACLLLAGLTSNQAAWLSVHGTAVIASYPAKLATFPAGAPWVPCSVLSAAPKTSPPPQTV